MSEYSTLTTVCRQITISINTIDAPQVTLEQDFLTADVGPQMTIADLKGYIESETNITATAQRIYYGNRELVDDSQTLQQCGMTHDSMLGVQIRNPQAPSHGSSNPVRAQRRGPAPAGPRQGAPTDPEMIRLQAMGNPNILATIRASDPELANAVQDPARFQQIFEEKLRQRVEMDAEIQRRNDLLSADPFNVDAQREIEEMIRQEGVIENLQNAMEHNPEGIFLLPMHLCSGSISYSRNYDLVFARVHMLYIPVEVNQHKVKAFVDSGAQTTIMSPSCAEKCGIYRLLDKRYAGVARGVGTAKILGRVHSAIIKIGSSFLPCSFTVMEGKDVDLLLGLDMLKKHQACIDLQKGKLIIQGDQVDFLGEADIPKYEDVYKDEPTIEGPAGTRTGAISGTVTQSAASAAASQATAKGPSSSSGLSEPQQPQSTTGSASFPKEDIEQLTSMGFTKQEAIHALEMAGGNVEIAAGLLL